MLLHVPLVFLAAWLLSAAAATLHALRKILHMPDQPMPAPAAAAVLLAAAAPVAAAPEAANDSPMATAGADPMPETSSPVVNSGVVVTSIVQTVQNHPDVPAAAAPSVIASILAGLFQAEPAIFAVSRASTKTQTEVNLGVGLAQIILGAFLHIG